MSGNDLEASIRAYTESLQHRIAEVLCDVNKDKLTDLIINRLAETELYNYADIIVKNAVSDFVKRQTKEMSNLLVKTLEGLITPSIIEKALKEQETLELLAKAITRRAINNLDSCCY